MELCKTRKAQFFKEDDGSEPVKDWIAELKRKGRLVEQAKINARINRAAQGNFGEHRFLAGGLGELKVDYGPGYRVYFGLDGEKFVILLSAGTKQNQQEDIEVAKKRWEKYLEAKSTEKKDGK